AAAAVRGAPPACRDRPTGAGRGRAPRRPPPVFCLTTVFKYSIEYLMMTHDAHRVFKDRLYGQFARIGKALGSPHRLELLELLAQGERTVDALASESALSMANASQHLQALREAGLVESRKQGLFVHYRLADPAVFELCRGL